MARMIPEDVYHDDFHGSYGEEKIYHALKALPNEYVVFHSVHWQRKKKSGNVSWGESDFTVFNPKRGLIVIEVKSGGVIHNNTGWAYRNLLTNAELPMKDPLVQAERSKFTFIDILGDKHPSINSYWVEAAVWFPSVESLSKSGDLPPAYSKEIILTARDINDVKKAIDGVFDYYKMYEQPYFNESDVLHVLTKLSPCFDAIPSLINRIIEEEYVINRMTQEQSYLLDYLEEQKVAAIQGGAGTGKTMLALEKARRLSAYGKVLFLCFNRFLLNMLLKSYSNGFPNIEFANLQSLVNKKKNTNTLSGNDDISDYLMNHAQEDWHYDHIIIDEAQDFFEDHLVLLSMLAQQFGGCFYVFYDKNQLVHQKQSSEWFHSFECKLVLSYNCRNTVSIAITSNKPIGIENIKVRVPVEGEKPILYLGSSREDALICLPKIIRTFTDNGLTKEEIVILTVKTEEASFLFGVSSVGNYKLVSDVNHAGILFTSARKYKGLESKAIIIVDFDERTFLNEEARRVLYVGASRAKHSLNILGIMDAQQLSEAAAILKGQKTKNAKLTISSQLKVRIVDATTISV